jgi:hypothetical protein
MDSAELSRCVHVSFFMGVRVYGRFLVAGPKVFIDWSRDIQIAALASMLIRSMTRWR